MFSLLLKDLISDFYFPEVVCLQSEINEWYKIFCDLAKLLSLYLVSFHLCRVIGKSGICEKILGNSN